VGDWLVWFWMVSFVRSMALRPWSLVFGLAGGCAVAVRELVRR
jgi:hypothetical protein